MTLRLMLSCGEPSGDLYAGAVLRELRALDSSVQIRGLAGPDFASAGGELLDDYRDLSVTGLTEPVRKLPRLYAAMKRLVQSARRERPDVFVAIDFPDFNFRLARQMKRLNVPVVYYIAPQLWAWRRGRVKTMREIADLVIVIFPFEEPLYRDAGIPVSFVGHPLVELARSPDPERILRPYGWSPDRPTVAILPGSRPNEVKRILPDLVAAAGKIREGLPAAQFIVARAPNLPDGLFAGVGAAADAGDRTASPNAFMIVPCETDAVLSAADLALTASGTATVQAAIHDTPMVIVYRVSPLTYRVVRRLVTVDMIGMVNLIAGEKIVPELIQDAFTPGGVAREALAILNDRARNGRVREALARVRERLGGPGASRRAAREILNVARTARGSP